MAPDFRSKKEVVYELLRDGIVTGKYKPGSRLVIDDLATTIKVSQIPIREAIQQLESDGFVTVEPYVGARVAEIDASFIFEVFALLESMEIICSRAACSLITDAQIDTLSQMIAEMDLTVADTDKWSEQNKALHLYICKCGETYLVLKMMLKVFDHWDRLRQHYLQNLTGNRFVEAQAEHKLLLEALKQRNPDAVEQIIRDHNQRALKCYIQYLKSEGILEKTAS